MGYEQDNALMDRHGNINNLGRQYIGEPSASHAGHASSTSFIFWTFIVAVVLVVIQ
jgi:hypothetical protein